MFFDEEEEEPSRPVPRVTIVSAPGKPRAPDWEVKRVKGEGKSPGDDKDKDQKRMEPCNVRGDDEEEEMVDPKEKLKECCSKSEKCSKLQQELQRCNDRVNSREQTAETCTMELFDFLHCVDHCVSHDLFHYLK